MFKIVIFEQEVIQKEDKNIKRYNMLDTNEYLKGNKKVIDKNINTFEVTDKILANCPISFIECTLKDINCSYKDNEIHNINGFFECLIVCITKTGTYKNMYVVEKNEFGLLTHKKVKSNALITEQGVIL